MKIHNAKEILSLCYICTEKRTLTHSDMETLKKEYQNLNDLLIPESKIIFTSILGEGM